MMGKFKPNTKDNMPFIIGAIAVVLIGAAIYALMPGGGSGQTLHELDSRVAYLNDRIVALEKQNGELKSQFEELNARMRGFADTVSQGVALPPEFGGIQERLAHVDTRIGNLERRFTGTEERSNKKTVSPAAQKPASPPAAQKPAATPAAVAKPVLSPEARKPASRPAPVAEPVPSGPKYHEIGDGDTLYSIARRYNITVDQLRSLNKLSPEAVLQPGQRIIVDR